MKIDDLPEARGEEPCDTGPMDPAGGPTGAATSAGFVSSFLQVSGASRGTSVALATRTSTGWDELTYADLDRRSAQVRTWLERAGVRSGDRVGLLGDSGGDWMAALFGILRRGAVAVPFDP